MRRNPRHMPMLAAGGRILQGTECRDRTAAKLLLFDRESDGYAFPSECVVRVPWRVYETWKTPRRNPDGRIR